MAEELAVLLVDDHTTPAVGPIVMGLVTLDVVTTGVGGVVVVGVLVAEEALPTSSTGYRWPLMYQ